MDLGQLTTPCALVDLERLERNVARFSERAHRLGVRLRPHVKTHKCVEAARLQVRNHFGGITVSTLAEARHFAAAGFEDMTWAVPIAPGHLEAAIDLHRRLERFNVLVDHDDTVTELERAASAQRVAPGVFLEVDCGGRRTGVRPESDRAVSLARRLHASPHVELRGVLTHAGHAYGCTDQLAVADVAAQERDVMVRFASNLEAAGVVVPEVSIGSTPTFAAVDALDGIGEVRPGNYVFFDVVQAAVGSCRLDDIALSVLAEVISVHPERSEVVLNTGALALSKDPGPVHLDPHCGYGVVCTVDDTRPLSGLRLVALTQEHGVVRGDPREAVDRVAVGDRLRVLPNHSCLTAAMFDRYHVVQSGSVVDEWRPVRGWS
jgi:D-serine deaminase-like pyridoxal phosphate-dependent protein